MLRAQLLKQETALDSISPDRAGGIMYDTLQYINQMQLQGANPLLISKIYASVAAMEADSAPVSDLTGQALRPGQVVVIASADSDNGSVYRYNGGTESRWTVVGKIGNLTPVDSLDSDSTQLPLAAHQGKVLGGKVGAIERDIYEMTYQDVTPDGSISGAYIGSNGRIYSGGSGYIVYKKYFQDATTISYVVSGSSMGILVADTEPEKNATYTIIASSGSGTYDVPAGKWIAWGYYSSSVNVNVQAGNYSGLKPFVTADELIATNRNENNSADRKMVSAEFSPLMVDWMQAVHAQSGMTSVAQMSIVSSTESQITLSAADAAAFTDPTPAVVSYANGDCLIVFLKAANGTSVSRADFETTSLSGAQKVQSLHDTVKGGAGIHLSPMGYIALAQFTAAQLATMHIRRDDLITGINFYDATESDGEIFDANGNKVADVVSTMETTGQIDGHLKSCGIKTDVQALSSYSNGWSKNGYYFLQGGTAGLYTQFDMKASGRGYVELQGALIDTTGNRIGTATIGVYVDGELVETKQVTAFNQERYTFQVSADSQISVRITLDGTSQCAMVIYAINFWRYPSTITPPALSGKKIAVLGDSWTQFPSAGDGLADYAAYNEIVTRPDGTQGNGYGYFPKELARVTGADVDNWGKSNIRADNWGLPEIDNVLSHADYDYILIEFFLNDFNAGISVSDWLHNIRKLAQKAIAKGVRPIIICPCRSNSNSSYSDYWAHLFRGWRAD